MSAATRASLVVVSAAMFCLPATAQTPATPASAPAVGIPAPAQTTSLSKPTGVAATVNGQAIPEIAVQRALRRVPPARHADARPELLNYLIDNLLLDQYLRQQNVAVDAKELESRFDIIRAEIKKLGAGKPDRTYEKILQELMLTEEEIKEQVAADMRWEKFAAAQATDQALRALFDSSKDVFDGSMVRARHILITPATSDQQATDKVRADLLMVKQQIETKVNEELAKLPATTDALAREQARGKLLEDAFAAAAREKSACPSKQQGGDLDFFPRAGSMVEPFAKAAFALKPHQFSDVVQTPFGYHLILATDRRPGKDIKFEDVKDEVKEVFQERLRDMCSARLRPAAKIAITPVGESVPAPKQ